MTYVMIARSAVALIKAFNAEIDALEQALSGHFETHPDAKVVRSQGTREVLGARVPGEFGDGRARFASGKSRGNYAATSPITKASRRSLVVLARHAKSRRLADACDQSAFCALTRSPGARADYDELHSSGKTHRQALRQLGNRLVDILRRCLEHGELYDEDRAWPSSIAAAV